MAMTGIRKGMFRAALLLLPALAAAGRAGEPAAPAREALAALEKQVSELLASPKETEQAWGAYLAGKHCVKAAVPALLKLTEKAADPADRRGKPARFYAEAALVDLGADLEEKALGRLVDERRFVLALALISAHPQGKEKLLLDLVDPARKGGAVPDAVWVAANNLLIEARAAGFAAGLIRETRVRLQVTVRDPVRGFGDGGGKRATMRFGDGAIDFGKEFPPIVYHQLTFRESSGQTLVAPGPKNVYLQRSESREPGRLGVGSVSGSFDREGYRLDCLAALLHSRPADLKLDLRPGLTVAWQDAKDLRLRAAGEIAEVFDAWGRLSDSLAEQELLTAEERRTAMPAVTLEVRDLRADRTKPLPSLDDLSAVGPAEPVKPDRF